MADRDKTVKVTVDMPARLVDSLRTKAEQEDRSFAAEMRQAVRRHLSSDARDGGEQPLKAA